MSDVVEAARLAPDDTERSSVDGHPPAPAELVVYGGSVRASAVLCAVFEEDGQASVVLTRRSGRLRSHTGEVAFPGGRIEPGETAIEAATREAHEEVALDPSWVTPVGFLADLTTSINPAPITPVVATLPARPVLVASPDEVDRVFTVPLVELLAPDVYHSEIWAWTDGEERTIAFFDLVGDTVWGATARMLSDLLDRLSLLRQPGPTPRPPRSTEKR